MSFVITFLVVLALFTGAVWSLDRASHRTSTRSNAEIGAMSAVLAILYIGMLTVDISMFSVGLACLVAYPVAAYVLNGIYRFRNRRLKGSRSSY